MIKFLGYLFRFLKFVAIMLFISIVLVGAVLGWTANVRIDKLEAKIMGSDYGD